MRRIAAGRHFWFHAAVALGLVLGLLLLVQSVVTYRYVSGRLVEQAAEREAERKVAALEKQVRDRGIREVARLADMLEELRSESPRQLAWIRIVDSGGAVLAGAGASAVPPADPGRLRRLFEERSTPPEVRETAAGKVHVSLHRLRLWPPAPPEARAASTSLETPPAGPPPNGARPSPRFGEVAVYLDGVSAPFGVLRQNLLVACSAAAALVGAMIVLMLHFRRFVRGRQLEEQLELARRVQAGLLPAPDPVSEDLSFAMACVPAWQVGGDFFDVFRTDDGPVALALGDVSGKGISAALVMALLHGPIRSGSWWSSAREHEESTARLNELLCAKTSPERFATLFWCSYDPEEAVVRYVNAGHPPPLILGRNGAGEPEVRRLTEGGPVLGVLPGTAYRQAEACVQRDDVLVLFSDGIVETMNTGEEEFGEDRLLAVIRANLDRTPDKIRDAILERVGAFHNGEPPEDDRTLVVVRFEPGQSKRAAAAHEAEGCLSAAI